MAVRMGNDKPCRLRAVKVVKCNGLHDLLDSLGAPYLVVNG